MEADAGPWVPRGEEIEILFDGDCPVCSREIEWLERRDRAGRIRAVDIAAPGFDPRAYGRSREELDARIHARVDGGEVIEGMEVFRRAYAAVGLGWLWAPTRWPLLRPLADRAYAAFARIRPHLPGRAGPRWGTSEGARP